MTSLKRWLPSLLLCCLSGCCSLSQGMVALFCGPSQGPWAKVSYRTPEEALKTFQAAVAREDVEVIYKSLSPDWKRREGFGVMEAHLVWEKLKEKYPGIHALGLAQVIATPTQEPKVVEYDLEVAFQQFRVRLKRYAYFSVVVAGEDGPVPHGDFVPRLQRHAFIRPGAEISRVQVSIPEVEIPNLRLEDVIQITVGREWKVDAFGPVPKT